MTCHNCSEKLHDFVDEALAPPDRAAVESHLATCATCQSALASLRALRAATARLPRELTPARDLWPTLSAQLCPPAAAPSKTVPFPLRLLPFAIAASLALLSTLLSPHASRLTPHASSWSVSPLAGAPRVAAQPVERESPFRVGQWLETDAASRAKVAVGSIGEVNVEPNSRVRLVATAATDHRIELARGTVDALIWAPPRLFFVDTPSATAVDLGCAYTLTVNDHGDGELHVTAGYVALEHAGRESIIPSGAKCLTRKGPGPGTPFAASASAALRTALETFDFGPPSARAAALATILAEAAANDAVTLWHLLSRTSGRDRAATFDTLSRLAPPPADVTRDLILAGHRPALRNWASALGLGTF